MNKAIKAYEEALRGMDDPNDESNTFEYEAALKLMTMTRQQHCGLFIEATEAELSWIMQCILHPSNYDAEVGAGLGRLLSSYMRPTIVADYEVLMQCDYDAEINWKADQEDQESTRRKEERLMRSS